MNIANRGRGRGRGRGAERGSYINLLYVTIQQHSLFQKGLCLNKMSHFSLKHIPL